jgi:diguanylate cyclase (GGDEF)-like protein
VRYLGIYRYSTDLIQSHFVLRALLISLIGTLAPVIGYACYHQLENGQVPAAEVTILLIATAVGAALSLVMLGGMLAPLLVATEALERYAKTRQLPNLPVGLPDHAGRLMTVVNSLTRRVEHLLVAQECQANTDQLTGLLNRRGVLDVARDVLLEARRFHRTVSIAVIDIDHFKQINDTLGHAAGDAALRGIAERLRVGTRETDLIARWGGEEFLIMFPTSRGNETAAIMERLRADIARHRFPALKGRELTISAGVAVIEPTEDEISQAVCRADEKLYAAKRGGRNRVCVDLVPESTNILELPARA